MFRINDISVINKLVCQLFPWATQNKLLCIHFSVRYLKTRLKSLRTQYTKSKTLLKSGSDPLSARRTRTLQKQRELLGFLEPHLRKRTSITNMVSIFSRDKKLAP